MLGVSSGLFLCLPRRFLRCSDCCLDDCHCFSVAESVPSRNTLASSHFLHKVSHADGAALHFLPSGVRIALMEESACGSEVCWASRWRDQAIAALMSKNKSQLKRLAAAALKKRPSATDLSISGAGFLIADRSIWEMSGKTAERDAAVACAKWREQTKSIKRQNKRNARNRKERKAKGVGRIEDRTAVTNPRHRKEEGKTVPDQEVNQEKGKEERSTKVASSPEKGEEEQEACTTKPENERISRSRQQGEE